MVLTLRFRKKRDSGQLICTFVFAYAKCKFSHDEAQMAMGLSFGYRSKRDEMSLFVRKPVFGVSDLVRHKPGCTGTEDG